MSKLIGLKLDRDRYLRYDINALANLEEATGMTIEQAMDEKKIQSLRVVRALVWAGLLHEDPKLKIETAGDLLEDFFESGGELTTIFQKITDAVLACGLFKKVDTSPKIGSKRKAKKA
jgi:hypothetical protein